MLSNQEREGNLTMQQNNLIALIIYIISSSAGVLIIKNFFNTSVYNDLSEFMYLLINAKLVGGVLLYMIGFIAWLYVLSKMNLNIIYPVAVTLSFLTILILSVFILKEKVTVNIFIGSVLCLLGIIVILR